MKNSADNPLALSDDDILNMPIPTADESESEEPNEEMEEAVEEEEEKKKEETTAENTEVINQEREEEEKKPTPSPLDKEDGTTTKDSKKETDTSSVDYKAEYAKLTAPFKANGKMVSIDSVDQAIDLMRKGIDYNLKMAAIKPQMKVIKTLEKHDLLDLDKVNFLVALAKKDTEAIKQLLKDSEIDPVELDLQNSDNESKKYTPNNYTVDDKEVALDGVIENLKNSQYIQPILQTISTEWDDTSKQIVYENPEILYGINEHFESGLYTKIREQVDSKRLIGQIPAEVPFIVAYKAVMDSMPAHQPKPAQSDKQSLTESDNKADLNKRRIAASPTKGSPKPSAKSEVNPLALSDEEFEKFMAQQQIV